MSHEHLLLAEEIIDYESDSEIDLASEEETTEDEDVIPTSTNPPQGTNCGLQALLDRLQSRVDEENRLNPWCFQNDPQWGTNEERPTETPDPQGRLLSTDWCRCGKCCAMPTVEESLCCHDFEAMSHILENHQCVTDYPQFNHEILTRDFLVRILQSGSHLTQRQFNRQENRYLRLTAYRSFTSMIYGFLGEHHRVPIPSCAVNKIREKYPDPEGEYTGFKWYPQHSTGPLPTHVNF